VKSTVNYCIELKNAFEAYLTRPHESSPEDPAAEIPNPDYDRLQRLFRMGSMAGSQVRFTAVYEGERLLLQWGQGPIQNVLGEIHVADPNDPDVIRAVQRQVYEMTARGPSDGVCKIIIPMKLDNQRTGRLVVGLVAPDASSQLAQLSDLLGGRALRLSMFGVSLLALVAAYIVYLNDRTRELELRLEQEKRLAYVGTIAAGMAHEIRNPLSSVKMNIQMIESRLSNFGKSESDYLVTKVSRIHRETARLEESINNFLAFARPKPLQRRWADLNESIDHVVEFLEPACSNDNIQTVRKYAPGLPQAYIDPEQLGQAVENLVRNAAQAIRKNGTIEIQTALHNSSFEIRVSDSGGGVPPEARDKIFDIFFTTKQGGTGLGLTIVKQIVEAHGGDVTFESAEKKGTTFIIHLPTNGKT